MDKKTQERLRRIGSDIPTRLLGNLVSRENDDMDIERIREQSKKLPKEKREHVEKMLRQLSSMNQDVINPKVEKEIEKHIDQNVRREMARGTIPKAKRDDFMRQVGV